MERSPRPLLLKNARAVLSDRVTDPLDILVEKGRIVRIIERTKPNDISDAESIELNELTLFPGFIDVHIHGAVGVDTLVASESDLKRVAIYLASKGVTGWLPTLVPAAIEGYQAALKSISDGMSSRAGARILGVHYEGPFVNSRQCGALRAEFFLTFTKQTELDQLPVLNDPAAIHMVTMAPEIEGGIELIAELKRRGWIISIGHTRAEFTLLDQAFAAGARHMTHFMNAMTPLHHREPGPVGWGLLRDDVTCDFIADGVHLDATVLKLLVKIKTANQLSLISDAIAAAGEGDGNYQIWEQTITVTSGRTQNAQGHIAGSVITMLEAVKMMRGLGVSATEIARMSATNPAKLLGLDDQVGSIREGNRADLVALDDNGEVVLTTVGGEIVFRREPEV